MAKKLTKRISQDIFVTVVILAESSEIDHIKKIISSTKEQTYKNLDILVVTNENYDVSSLKSQYVTDHRVRWMTASAGLDAVRKAQEKAVGEYICYRTINNVEWFPRHIEVHVEEFLKHKSPVFWSCSLVEYRDINLVDQPFNTLGWRIEASPALDKICLDEIVFCKSLVPKWENTIVDDSKTGKRRFLPGNLIKEWNQEFRGCVPDEITVICWTSTSNDSEKPQSQEEGLLVAPGRTSVIETVMEDNAGEVYLDRDFPTIFGNIQLDQEYNNPIRSQIYVTKRVHHVAFKRCMGMGDIILTQPIIGKLKKIWPDAKFTFFTSDRTDCRLAAKLMSGVDEVVAVPGVGLFQDYLADVKYQNIRFDFDLTESRYGAGLLTSYQDGYAQTAGIKLRDEERRPSLHYNNFNAIFDKPYVLLSNEGSGWGGRELSSEKWIAVLEKAKSLGYEVIEPTYREERYLGIGIRKFVGCSFPDLVNLVYHAKAIIASDNGVMHLACAFKKPSFIVWGATKPELVHPCWNSDEVCNVEMDIPCRGCKHRFFFQVMEGGVRSFVPPCELSNQEQYKCMKELSVDYLLNKFDEFMERI